MKKKHKIKPNGTFYLRIVLICILAIAAFGAGIRTRIPGIVFRDKGVSQPAAGTVSYSQSDALEIYFLDVGQGDCTLAVCGEAAVLIDSGEAQYASQIVSSIQALGIERLDLVVISHFHSDHAGAMAAVLQLFPVGELVCPAEWADVLSWRSVMNAVGEYQIPFSGISGRSPEEAQVSAEADSFRRQYGDMQVELIFPGLTPGNPAQADNNEENNASLVFRISNGVHSLLAGGDAGFAEEEAMLQSGVDLRADIWKASHHGSAGSGEAEFLTAVNPQAAVISCGENNPYGLPSERFLDRLEEAGIPFWRTDELGTIYAAAGEAGAISVSPAYIPDRPADYVLNRNTMRYHLPDCSSVPDIAAANRIDWNGSAEWLRGRGFVPCGRCLAE